MSTLKEPTPGFLFFSLLYRKDLHSLEDIKKFISPKVHKLHIFEHEYFPMKRYYSKEMGDQEKLARVFLLDLNPTQRMKLKELKLWAQDEEEKFGGRGSRTINIDVGMITLENLQLATSKNFTHRVYLGDKVFSDLTLIFQGKSFTTMPWSYPDYSHEEIITFFNWARKQLHHEIKNSL